MSNLVFSHKLRSSALPSITVLISREQVDAHCRTCCIDKKREEEEEPDKKQKIRQANAHILLREPIFTLLCLQD